MTRAHAPIPAAAAPPQRVNFAAPSARKRPLKASPDAIAATITALHSNNECIAEEPTAVLRDIIKRVFGNVSAWQPLGQNATDATLIK